MKKGRKKMPTELSDVHKSMSLDEKSLTAIAKRSDAQHAAHKRHFRHKG